MIDNSAKTAITRTKSSFPIKFLVDYGYLHGRVLHYGSGKDYKGTKLLETVASVTCYDPTFAPDKSVLVNGVYNSIVCNYVLNVLPYFKRRIVIEEMSNLSRLAFITVRTDCVNGTIHEDGVITKKGTFQKTYTKETLKEDLRPFFWNVDVLYQNSWSLIARAMN